MRTANHLESERDSPRYLEVPPSPDLTPWISHFRVIRGPAHSNAVPTALRLLTDGCTGIVIDCGPSELSSPPVFVGVMQRASVVTVAESREIIGVRFTPGGALPFVTPSVHEFTGRRVPLPLLWGELAQRMGTVVRSATSSERVHVLEHCLRGRLRQHQAAASGRRATTAPEVALVSRSIAHLGHHSTVRVSDVAEALGVGERRLDHWSAIGSDAGYADQAHFIREFRALTGVTPVAYATERHPVGFMQYDTSRPS